MNRLYLIVGGLVLAAQVLAWVDLIPGPRLQQPDPAAVRIVETIDRWSWWATGMMVAALVVSLVILRLRRRRMDSAGATPSSDAVEGPPASGGGEEDFR
ncbi:MAG: hypothetical protein L0G72_14465 [Brevibacterium aurantiacum]|nr:hypothetical protein [Brevibacterium aurantiacum]